MDLKLVADHSLEKQTLISRYNRLAEYLMNELDLKQKEAFHIVSKPESYPTLSLRFKQTIWEALYHLKFEDKESNEFVDNALAILDYQPTVSDRNDASVKNSYTLITTEKAAVRVLLRAQVMASFDERASDFARFLPNYSKSLLANRIPQTNKNLRKYVYHKLLELALHPADEIRTFAIINLSYFNEFKTKTFSYLVDLYKDEYNKNILRVIDDSLDHALSNHSQTRNRQLLVRADLAAFMNKTNQLHDDVSIYSASVIKSFTQENDPQAIKPLAEIKEIRTPKMGEIKEQNLVPLFKRFWEIIGLIAYSFGVTVAILYIGNVYQDYKKKNPKETSEVEDTLTNKTKSKKQSSSTANNTIDSTAVDGKGFIITDKNAEMKVKSGQRLKDKGNVGSNSAGSSVWHQSPFDTELPVAAKENVQVAAKEDVQVAANTALKPLQLLSRETWMLKGAGTVAISQYLRESYQRKGENTFVLVAKTFNTINAFSVESSLLQLPDNRDFAYDYNAHIALNAAGQVGDRMPLARIAGGGVDLATLKFFDQSDTRCFSKYEGQDYRIEQSGMDYTLVLLKPFKGFIKYTSRLYVNLKVSDEFYEQNTKIMFDDTEIKAPDSMLTSAPSLLDLNASSRTKTLELAAWSRQFIHYGNTDKSFANFWRKVQVRLHSVENDSQYNYIQFLIDHPFGDCNVGNLFFEYWLRKNGIPSQIVAGIVVPISERETAYSIDSEKGHAVTEVFYNGTVNVHDATPIKIDQKPLKAFTKQESDLSLLIANALELEHKKVKTKTGRATKPQRQIDVTAPMFLQFIADVPAVERKEVHDYVAASLRPFLNMPRESWMHEGAGSVFIGGSLKETLRNRKENALTLVTKTFTKINAFTVEASVLGFVGNHKFDEHSYVHISLNANVKPGDKIPLMRIAGGGVDLDSLVFNDKSDDWRMRLQKGHDYRIEQSGMDYSVIFLQPFKGFIKYRCCLFEQLDLPDEYYQQNKLIQFNDIELKPPLSMASNVQSLTDASASPEKKVSELAAWSREFIKPGSANKTLDYYWQKVQADLIPFIENSHHNYIQFLVDHPLGDGIANNLFLDYWLRKNSIPAQMVAGIYLPFDQADYVDFVIEPPNMHTVTEVFFDKTLHVIDASPLAETSAYRPVSFVPDYLCKFIEETLARTSEKEKLLNMLEISPKVEAPAKFSSNYYIVKKRIPTKKWEPKDIAAMDIHASKDEICITTRWGNTMSHVVYAINRVIENNWEMKSPFKNSADLIAFLHLKDERMGHEGYLLVKKKDVESYAQWLLPS